MASRTSRLVGRRLGRRVAIPGSATALVLGAAATRPGDSDPGREALIHEVLMPGRLLRRQQLSQGGELQAAWDPGTSDKVHYQ